MDHGTHGQSNGMRWRARLVFLSFAAIAGFFLVTEHRAHLLGYLPWILLLAFPLLHIFMHGGHGGHGGHGNPDRSDQETSRRRENQPGESPAGSGTHHH